MRLGIDLMGGESPPEELFKAVLRMAEELSFVDEIIVLATCEVVEVLKLTTAQKDPAKNIAPISFHIVSDVIDMQEAPLVAIRRKKNSSLVTGIRLLQERHIAGFVSAGNTGALIASATLMLPLLPGIDRLALLAVLPTKTAHVAVLDVGASISARAENLMQFVQMGVAFQQCSQGIERPVVGLLNIGVESLKGTSEVRRAYHMLKNHPPLEMIFAGNVEGREVFEGKVDVLVTEGFSGNIFLKTAEGASAFLVDFVNQSLKEHMTLATRSALTHLERHFDYEEYPGAIVCGVEGVIVKCHGASTSKGMLNAMRGAVNLIRNNLLIKIKERMR